MNTESGSKWKLGMFVIIGVLLFIITIYFIGKNRNLFGSTFNLKSEFKNVSGLKVGSNVRLSGINIGTVNKIEFISDSLVLVKLLIKDEVQQYIKTDATASIGSDGLVGDKVLIISPGTTSKKIVKNNAYIMSNRTIELEDIMNSVKKSADNAEIITHQLADFSFKMNDNKGILSKIMTNQNFSNSIERSLSNLEIITKEIANFTPKMNNPNSAVSKLFTDKNFANGLDITNSNLQKSSNDLAVFTSKINNENNVFTKLMTDETYAKNLESILKNLEKSSNEFAEFTSKINDESNVLSKLIDNKRLGKSIDSTITKLENSAKGLKELENAAKDNFLLKGYFSKNKKTQTKKQN
ncbi:MlaD family protein [Flavobacterium luteum]|uniref:MCE family protein n=1 Tax=Flavobacterium luteum TaxID=2026654 RepID=A0A7J5AJ20_9FLAO|nr:MlaD family protein [Flavobacterium luteum]KAB1157576.1 MCE family protein [Flavobacterium luteum]